jgi:DNA-binding transcriptional MocR family regulator
MRELRAEDSILARALEFAILAGSRSAKVREAKWNEIDMASAHPRRAHEVRPAARRPAVRACRGSAGHHAARAIDRVIYAGTFSKLLFPAIRLAYLVLPERLIDPFVSALSLTARHMPIWNQVILADFIAEGHFSRHLRRMRMLYSERSKALQEAAQTYWSDFLVMPRIESGLDVAVLLKPRIDDQAAAAAAERASIELRSLSWHSQRRPRLSGFVIGFAAIDTRGSLFALHFVGS